MKPVIYKGKVMPVTGLYAVTADGILLNPRLDLRNHSPTGFAWGYCGSGPAQLSLAILCHALKDDDRALRLYQTFKERVIAAIPGHNDFVMSSDWIQQIIENEIDPPKEIDHTPV